MICVYFEGFETHKSYIIIVNRKESHFLTITLFINLNLYMQSILADKYKCIKSKPKVGKKLNGEMA